MDGSLSLDFNVCIHGKRIRETIGLSIDRMIRSVPSRGGRNVNSVVFTIIVVIIIIRSRGT